MRKINCFLLFATLTFRWSVGENRLYHLDGVELFHRVSDKFLSISVDPAVLLAGVKLSDDSLKLVRNLSPAYIRLAGPSTRFVKYLDKKEQTFSFKDKYHNIYVTPSMWFGINEWFRLAKLSPVFAIYDANSSEGVWNPNSTLPLLEFSDKLDIQCYWQLGNDCDNKTLVEYVDKIHILRQTLNGFPDHINNWKIVGSDLSKCNFDETDSSSNGKLLDDLDITVTAITWQSPFIDKVDLGLTKADLWTSVPKETGPVTFDSAIQWAIEVGQAALLGNSVIFKELRLLELTHDTPVYWFSVLHKRLMGFEVLSVGAKIKKKDLLVYSHCARNQNGDISLFMVNNGSESTSIKLRLENYQSDVVTEVHSYFLQAADDASLGVLLNNRTLTADMLEKPDDVLRPILRRANVRPFLTFKVPGRAIAFFVLTRVQYAKCSNSHYSEEEVTSVLEEVENVQKKSAFLKFEPRIGNLVSRSHFASKNTLEAIRDNILKEAEVDKLYYDSNNENLHPKPSLVGKADELKRNSKDHLHLSIGEIENILKQRARAKAAARNIRLTSAELDMLVEKATLKIPKYFVSKRDINRALLEENAQGYQNNMHNEHFNDDKQYEIKRMMRNINMPLLNLKSLQEEHKKYLFDTRKPQAQKAKRDINLDLVKQRTQVGSKRTLSLPKFMSQNYAQESKGVSKNAPVKVVAQSSEDLFDDLMQFEDRTFEDSLAEQESFPDLSDSNDEETKHYFISKKANNAKVFAKPQYPKLVSMTNKPKKSLPVLKPSTEMGLLDDEWFCDGFRFSEELSDSFRRKKRKTSTEAITKDKLKNLKTTTRNEIKKLKQQLKLEKTSYLRQKLKSKKHLASKSNIQKVPKHNVRQLIENAVSAENAIDHKQKRSLNANGISFGKYKSKVSELEDWKPADILGLKQEDIPSPVQGRKRSDFAETRQKRYIDDQLENVSDNKIFDDDQEWKHDREDRVKLFNYENAKWKKGTPRKLLKNWNTQRKELDTSNNNTEFDARVTSEDQIRRVETNQLNNLISKAAPDLYEDQEITTKIPYIESATTKHIMRSNLTYLERVLGKNKAIPIDMFFKNIKSAFEGVKDFVRNIV
ncbi:uncharacterized protein LOC109535142 isoform X2 [Dendroctonus ponderosae]|uniref:Heparanase n=1 Tax=Dendroctonus ponderosae TaxID=77166 RepID=A0AAR5P602_DENPD|nr:uncharacterized protein LOC109535142 isoform X2 [Dendroctonus ponderosae]